MVLVACVRAVCVALSRCVWSAGREVSRPLAPLLRLGTDPPSPRDEDHVESRSDPFFAEILRFRSELDLRSLRSLRPEVVPPSGLSRERSTTLSSSSSSNRPLRSFTSMGTEGSRRGRLGCGRRPATRRRQTGTREYAGDAPRRGEGDGAHAVRLGRAPGRRVGGAGADDRVDERLGVNPEAASLLHGEGDEAVVGVASENEVTVLADLACGRLRR